MSNELIDEVSGVYVGTLLEDMIDTVNRVKRPYIDCDIPEVLEKTRHPLTYVPAVFMTYPLKKGDKVLVRFNQNNFRYPVLWKIQTEFESKMTEAIQFPSNGQVISFPTSEKVVSVVRVTADYYVYVTDKYTLIRTGDQFTLLSPDGLLTNVTKFEVLADSIILETKQEYKLIAAKAVTLKSSGTDLVEIGNSIDTLGGVLDTLFDYLDQVFQKMGTLHTEGPPTNHTGTAWYGTDIAPIQAKVALLRQKAMKVFKK